MEKNTSELLIEFFEFTKTQFQKVGEEFITLKNEQEKVGKQMDIVSEQVLLLSDEVKDIKDSQKKFGEQLDEVHTDVKSLAIDLHSHSVRVIDIDKRVLVLEGKNPTLSTAS